jgi:glycosyltransferase involved in cell wall biosynthesis
VTRVLIVHPRLVASGGGNGVAAWALQALRGRCELSVATLEATPPAVINDAWGTSLRDGDYRVRTLPAPLAWARRAWPADGKLLEWSLIMRFARALDHRHRYDVLLSTHNAMDLGRRSVCYVHEPWSFFGAGAPSSGGIAGLLYRSSCRTLAGADDAGLARNLLLANSAFTARRVHGLHGVEPEVLYPPVAAGSADVPWRQRERAVVAVGRLNGCKRWDDAVRIVEEVRRRGHPLTLTLVAHADDPVYRQGLERMAADRPWFRMRVDVSRDELRATLARHRYGLHAMIEEPFGMGPAEIVAAGCLLFAHRSGGPVEIVDGEPLLLFDDIAGAVERIERVLCHEALEAELRQRLDTNRGRFAPEVFCASLAERVLRFAREGR